MWAIAKEFFGFLGAVLLVLPWLRDFRRRLNLDRIRGIKAKGSIAALLDAIKQNDENWLASPKPLHLGLTILGLLFLGASFLIGLFLAIGRIASS